MHHQHCLEQTWHAYDGDRSDFQKERDQFPMHGSWLASDDVPGRMHSLPAIRTTGTQRSSVVKSTYHKAKLGHSSISICPDFHSTVQI